MAGRKHGQLRDTSGKGMIKFALMTCVLAIGVANASPGLLRHPLIGGQILEMRDHLPDALDKITSALGG